MAPEPLPLAALRGAQKRVVDGLLAGRRLVWFGDNGPEMEGSPFWPQKRTVRVLLKKGILIWAPFENESQREARICGLVLSPEVSDA